MSLTRNIKADAGLHLTLIVAAQPAGIHQMPHVIVKLMSGRSERQKAELAEAITTVIMSGAQCAADAISVGIEDIEATGWAEKVYKPDITGEVNTLYKRPGYSLS